MKILKLFKYFVIIYLISNYFTIQNVYSEKNDKEPYKPFLGVYMVPKKNLGYIDVQYEGIKGISVPVVIYKSAAEEYGIRAGDIILEYDGKNFQESDKINKIFRDYIRDEKKIGDAIHLKILRINKTYSGNVGEKIISDAALKKDSIDNILEKQKIGEDINLNIIKNLETLEIDVILGKKTNMLSTAPPPNSKLFPQYDINIDSFVVLSQVLIREYSLVSQYKDLIERYEEDEWWDDGFRSSFFRYIHRDPLKLPIIANDISIIFESSFRNNSLNIDEILHTAALVLDEKLDKFSKKTLDIKNVNECIDYIVGIIKKAKKYRDKAFSQLTKEDIATFEKHLLPLMDKFVKHYYLDSGSKMEEMENHRKILSITHKVDYQSLIQSALVLSSLADESFLKIVKQLDFEKNEEPFDIPEGIYGDVYLARETEAGTIVVGGPGFTKYTKYIPIIIDIGGNDLYLNNAGSAINSVNSMSFLLDLEGNDYYSSTETISQGSAFLGSALLVDLSGDDFYTGKQIAQGSGILGVGILMDFDGNDSYNGQEYQQGVGFWGFGALIDIKGDDRYSANLFAQGIGGTKGLGLLFDIQGNDNYYASGKYKSSYETDGIFRGSSQGFGIGFRGIASGGTGILLDGSGNDHFIAGNFSQGGGYFFGMGILKNSGLGDDIYIASRYGQGFSAHSALGVLIDVHGNDYYKGLHGAVQSAAWDLGAAALIDKQGDDIYDTAMNFFSQAAAAHNGFSMFLDMKGKDRYISRGPDGICQKQPNDYHDGSSFGFFIDNGGNEDIYSSQSNKNSTIYHVGNNSLFIDLPWLFQENLNARRIRKLIKNGK